MQMEVPLSRLIGICNMQHANHGIKSLHNLYSKYNTILTKNTIVVFEIWHLHMAKWWVDVYYMWKD